MKFRVVLISALLASLTGVAQAQTIIFADGSSGANPSIIRGAPERCNSRQPLVINVAKALRENNQGAQKCKVRYKRADHDRKFSITNIVVVAPYYERVYIKHH